MTPARWRKPPRPDEDVVRALEMALEAARRGHVRSMALVVVNQLHEAETSTAGDLGPVRRTIIVGALSAIAHNLISPTPIKAASEG